MGLIQVPFLEQLVHHFLRVLDLIRQQAGRFAYPIGTAHDQSKQAVITNGIVKSGEFDATKRRVPLGELIRF